MSDETSVRITGQPAIVAEVGGKLHGTPILVEVLDKRDYTIHITLLTFVMIALAVLLGQIRDEMRLGNCIAGGRSEKACKSVE